MAYVSFLAQKKSNFDTSRSFQSTFNILLMLTVATSSAARMVTATGGLGNQTTNYVWHLTTAQSLDTQTLQLVANVSVGNKST